MWICPSVPIKGMTEDTGVRVALGAGEWICEQMTEAHHITADTKGNTVAQRLVKSRIGMPTK